MADFLSLSTFFYLLVTTFGLWYIYFKLVTAKYWKNKGIPHKDPTFLLGSSWKGGLITDFGSDTRKDYEETKQHKVLGGWFFSKPMIQVNDLELVKSVLVKDFQHFHDRGIVVDTEKEPLNANLFNLHGSEWRNLRVKLTPTFTSGKMKMMFPIMVECGQQLQNFLKTTAETGATVEIKDVSACYTTDVISSCAFGIQTNSLKNPDGEFRKYGKKIFDVTVYQALVNIILFLFPNFSKKLPIRQTPKDVEDFFMNAVQETVEYREKNKVQRNDFLQLLIELKNKGIIEDADSKHHHGEQKEKSSEVSEQKFTITEAAAQAFVFFFAGFETSSTTMQFAFYELAMNPDVQVKLQKEIDKVLAKHENKVTYEAVQEMEYLEWVVQETLRKYPPVPVLFRECTKDYYLPEFKTTIDKGTPVFIPAIGFHYDPEIFPNPEKFDPNRFSFEEKSKRDPFFHLPFGEGPRICIGNRFALMQTKVGLLSVLMKYNVEVAKETPIPIEYDPRAFVLTPIKGMPLKITMRK